MTAVSQCGHALQHAAEATVLAGAGFRLDKHMAIDINDPTHIPPRKLT